MTSPHPEKIGRYKILEKVGRGGMGVLLRGIDPILDREVAIKLMLVDFSEDAEQMRPRFYREALAAAKLQHPNIVTVFEFAEDGTTPYIVMEFLRGTSLSARMTSPVPLALDDKLSIIAQLCSALHYAHGQGVVHRDIKPANIFLLPDGSVKLLDFGIAKLATSTMTRQGDVLGSAAYMSPEQVSGSPSIDGRSDIFSTGVVLYELLANRKPFNAETLTATVVQILNEEPPSLDSVAPGLPPQLVAAVKRALAKDPTKRFANAGELGKELQLIRQNQQTGNQGALALEETRFASPTEVRALQKELEKDRKESETGAPAPATGVASAPAQRSWIVPVAAVGVIAIVVGGALFMRDRAATESTAGDRRDAATQAAGPAGSAAGAGASATPAELPVQVESVPPGAAIVLDGKPTNLTTPAVITVSTAGPHRLRLTRAGFTNQEVDLGEKEIRQGKVSYTLAPAEVVMVAVSIDSTYPVDVFSGSQNLSRANQSHRLKVPTGATLRITAPQYLLSTSVRVTGKPIEYHAPALGALTVLTRHETCNVKIGDRVLGFPPISKLPVAAGQYRVDIDCPNGQNPPGQIVTVPPNQTATARIY